MALRTFREAFMPYCLTKLPNGKWVILNREYVPLGYTTAASSSIDYQKIIEESAVPLKLTPKKIAKLAAVGLNDKRDTSQRFWLYNDSCAPFNKKYKDAYLEKIKLLMDLEVI